MEPNERIGFVAPVVIQTALVVLVAIVGLVRGGENADPADLIIAAPEAAHAAGSARMALRFEVADFETRVDGLVDFRTGSAELEVAELGVRYEVRTIDETVYVHLRGLSLLGLDFEWIGMPIEGMDMSAADPAYFPNGTGYVESLRGVSGEVEDLGTGTVNGHAARGFRVQIDDAEILEWVPEAQRSKIEAALAGIRSLDVPSWPLQVWLDGRGLPVRIVSGAGEGAGSSTLQIDYTDFGVDTDIVVPPADATVHADSIADALAKV